jgi:hypothetical protein
VLDGYLVCTFIVYYYTQRDEKHQRKNLHLQVCKEGAWVENKGAVLTFHYRKTPTHVRDEIVPRARKLIESHGFKVGVSHCALEARPPVAWDKGRASIYILRNAFGYNWSERIRIIYAGDDVTDEDAMQASMITRVTAIFCCSVYTCLVFICCQFYHEINPLLPNDIYICPAAPLTSRCSILNIYSTNIRTEYFEHAA